ncbi:MAG TPA: hypothetical protein VIV12_28505 [Streptosporangiaceae bacterium]
MSGLITTARHGFDLCGWWFLAGLVSCLCPKGRARVVGAVPFWVGLEG